MGVVSMSLNNNSQEEIKFDEVEPLELDGKKLTHLKLKNYIQPFERVLACSELEGLTGQSISDYELKNNLSIYTEVPTEILRGRLAYWEKIGDNHLIPTLQVLLECSVDSHDKPVVSLPKSRRLRYGPHDLHEYRGKFFPQLVKSLINTVGLPEGGLVLDPMCGSGTTNCEARAMGMETIGLDLNPLSVMIAKTKTGIMEVCPEELSQESSTIVGKLSNVSKCDLESWWGSKDLEYLSNWFDANALQEIARILQVIDSCNQDVLKGLFRLCLSNILRSVSWQRDSDLRVRKEVTTYIEGDATTLFIKELNEQVLRLVPYLKIIQQRDRVSCYDIREGDTRNIASIFKSKVNKCDVLITSPPYATALPYLDTDRLSLIVLGLLPRKEHRKRDIMMIGNREVTEKQRSDLWNQYLKRSSELPSSVCNLIDYIADQNHKDTVGFRRRNLPALLAKYFLDISDSMKNALAMMKPGAYAYYVVGNNSTMVNDERVEIATNIYLFEIGSKVGWQQEKFIDMELLHSRDIFRKNRGTSESILVFRARGEY